MTYPAGVPVTIAQMAAQMPQLIGSVAPGSSVGSITIPIPSGYNFLKVSWHARSDTAATATNAVLQLNADSGNNYLWEQLETNNTTTTATTSGGVTSGIHIGAMPAASATGNYFGDGEFTVSGLQVATYKVAVGVSSAYVTTSNSYIGKYGGQWLNTTAVSSLTLKAVAGNLISGSILSIYGTQ